MLINKDETKAGDAIKDKAEVKAENVVKDETETGVKMKTSEQLKIKAQL